MKKFLLMLLFLSLSFFINSRADAHPHVFIDYKVGVIFDNKGLSGFKFAWKFDDITSTMLMEDYDLNKDKKLDKNETNLLHEQSFGNMKQFNYFTEIKLNDKPLPFSLLKDFSVSLKKNLATYNFSISCKIPVKKEEQKVSIYFIDKTNYVAFSPDKNPVSYKSNPAISYEDLNKSLEEADDNKEILFKFKDKK